MDYSKANETLNMLGGNFQKMMEGLSDWSEKMVKEAADSLSQQNGLSDWSEKMVKEVTKNSL